MTELTATIGGVHLRFHARHPDVSDLLAIRFGDFVDPESRPSRSIDVEIDLDARLAPPAADETFELSELSSGALILAGQNLRADVAADNRSATVHGPMAPQSLDAVVRLLLARELLERGALLIHASAVVTTNGRGVAFVGPSGSGKTTIAERLPYIVAGDEAVIVSEQSGTVMVTGTPYWHGRPITAPLDAMLFIARGSEAAWRDVSPSRAAARLFAACGPLPSSASEKALAVSARLVDRMPRCADVVLSTVDEIRGWLVPRIGMAPESNR